MPIGRMLPCPPVFPFVPIDSDTPRIRSKRIEQIGSLNQHADVVHAHHFPQIIYCEQGGGVHRLGDRQWETRAGDLFLIAPYEVHDASHLEAERWVLQFTVDAIASYSEGSFFSWHRNPLLLPFLHSAEGGLNYFNVAEHKRAALAHYLHASETELRLKQIGYREAARSFLTLILVAIVRDIAENYGHSFQEHPLLVAVFEDIEAHFSEPISLVDAARFVGKSPAYLTTIVRRLTGRTVLEWITERRMAEARSLLLQTNEPLTSICSHIGYRDANFFIRLFHRIYDVTPGEWRRANR